MYVPHIDAIRGEELIHRVVAANGASGYDKDRVNEWYGFRLDRPGFVFGLPY